MDPVSILPVEVAQKIFILLEIKDLYQCMSVCKNWRSLINCNYIWGHFYKIYDIEQLCDEKDDDDDDDDDDDIETKILSPLCSCAIELKRFSLSPAFNWRFGRSSNYYINLKFRQWKAVCCEPYIAVLYLSSNELHIFCCFPKSVERIDVISINLPVNSIEQPILINKTYIVIGAYNITLVYKLINKSFKLYKAFALKCDDTQVICANHGFNNFIQEYILSDCTVFEKVLIDDVLWITDRNDVKYIINLNTGQQDIKQELFRFTKVVKNSQYVLNFVDANISITDINGMIISSFTLTHSSKVCYMNKSILVICFPRVGEDMYKIECREIISGKLIRTLSVGERTRVTLHPKKSILYLFAHHTNLYTVSSLCIETGFIIWFYETVCGPHMFWCSFLSVINERFLFVYPAPSSDDFYALFNLQGKLLYEEVYLTTGILLHFSDAVVLAKEEGRLHVSAFLKSIHY